MSKSRIALAILAGAAIGAIVTVALTVRKELEEEEDEFREPEAVSPFDNIARQFSDRISSDLKAAENKIKSVVSSGRGFVQPEGEFGIFL